MALGKLKVRRIEVNGKLRPGVYAKDVILHIIRLLGVNGGIGYAYEYAGSVFDALLDGRAHDRLQHVASRAARAAATSIPTRRPSPTCKGRPYSPKGAAWDGAVRVLASRSPPTRMRAYDDVVNIRGRGHRSRPSPGASTRRRPSR